MKTIDQIKNSLTCVDYMVSEHGSKIIGNRTKSFRPDAKNNTSLMVNEQDWFDFGDNQGGDVIDLCAIDKFNGDKGQAIRYLCEKLNIQNDYSQNKNIEVIFNTYLGILNSAADIYHSFLTDTQRTYFHKRGITDKTIDELKIGWSLNPCEKLQELGYVQEDISATGLLSWINRLVFPYLRNGKCQYMVSRASVWEELESSFADSKYMKLKRTEESENPIWGIDSLRRQGPVIIAEGIMDAISCYQEGYAVLTAVTGAFSANQKKELYSLLKGREVIVCMDYDPISQAGQKFTEKLANELYKNGILCKVVNLNNGKLKIDINELYAENPRKETLENLFSESKKWIDVKIDEVYNIKNEDERKKEFAKLMKELTFVVEYADIAQYIANALESDIFPKEWLKELKKNLKAPPSELEIVEIFKEKYDAVYHPQLGWHLYEDNVWQRLPEEFIGKKVKEVWGKHATINRITGTLRALKIEVAYKGEFNTNEDLINFPNGMYSLSQGKLIEHDKSYMSSIQMSYEFNPNATCPGWTKFIWEISAGDERRCNLIQEMFGYAINRNMQLQKCFYLTGEGANGKSVLLKTLESLVGYKNATHIELAYMDSPFNRIQLMNSMVNICMDMKTDVKGVESYFKAIVSGDPIDGCYKGKDIVNFIPKSKMFFAANEMLSMKTIDYSILRRIIFLKFEMKFVSDPKKDNEMQIDYELQGKLEKELAGIFNWALTGYKSLIQNKMFTITQDQETLEYETKALNDNLIGFVEEYKAKPESNMVQRKNKKEVYTEYCNWCNDNNYRPWTSRRFWLRLKDILPYTTEQSNGHYFVTFEN
jgi:putative DNA primase/helicase